MLSQAINYDDAPGTWLGVNSDKRAAEQETTTMHQARGWVLTAINPPRPSPPFYL